MRKLLLASAAGLGALTFASTDAAAQYSRYTAPQASGPVIQNEPGLALRLAGRYRFYAVNGQSDFQNSLNPPGTATGERRGSFDFFDLGRLWPGFDGQAANGLRYGAQLEIRFGSANARGDGRSQLFYRRMYGYVATPTLGQLRFGSGQTGAVELLHTGHIMGAVASGLWDGDLPTGISGQPASVFWYSASGGNNATKIGYYTPQFFGFDAGLSFAPNDGNFENQNCAVVALGGTGACDRTIESSLDGQAQRIRNIYEIMLRYRGSFGPVGLQASGGYLGADTIGTVGTAAAYQSLSVGIFGAQATFAGVTFGGITSFGRANYASNTRTVQTAGFTTTNTVVGYGGGTPLRPLADGTGNDDGLFTWQLGARYAIGPFGVGIAYHEASYEGSQAIASNAKDKGLGIGASYAVAPGLNLFLEYLYGTREENGVDLRSAAAGGTTTHNGNNNKFTTNVIGAGIALNW
jgi:predicted porin